MARPEASRHQAHHALPRPDAQSAGARRSRDDEGQQALEENPPNGDEASRHDQDHAPQNARARRARPRAGALEVCLQKGLEFHH